MELGGGEIVTWRELRDAGLSARQIASAVDAAELHRLGRGTYGVGAADPAPHVPRHWKVALRRAGPDARVAGAAAARLWGLDGFDDHWPPLQLEVPASSGCRGPHIRRVALNEPAAVLDGVPACPVERVLLCAGARLEARPGCLASRCTLRPDELVELAVEDALRRRLTDLDRLHGVVAGCGRRTPGRAVLRQVLERRPAAAPATESYLESRMIQLLRRAGIREPQRQVEIRDGGRFVARVDLLLDQVVIESDGWLYHHTADEQGRDRARTNRLHALGYVVVAFTFDQIEHQPRLVADIVETVRARGRARPGG